MILTLTGAALVAVAMHPFTTYPASLKFLAQIRPKPLAAGTTPETAALCVCAFNEERVIRQKALNMLAMQDAFPDLELLIYVDAGSDRTAAILEEFADRIHVVVAPQRTGKTVGMNLLTQLTKADCLIFSDANVMIEAEAVPRLLAQFADPDVGVACGHLQYGHVRLEEEIKRLESATGSVMGADGSIFAMRRRLYSRPPADLIDDMYVSLSALCDGARVVRVGDALAFEDQVSEAAEEFQRKVRIACQGFNVHRALWPRLRRLPLLDVYKYVSHKLIRWLVVYFLVVGSALVAAGLALSGQWVALAAEGVAFLVASCVPALRSILFSFAGAGLGVARSMRGHRYQTWSPPASSRIVPVDSSLKTRAVR
jgi:hypothetical protein